MAAISHSLVLSFKDADAENISMTFAHAKSTPSASDVKTLMNGIISNSSIYQKQPSTIVGAKLITKTTTDIELS